MSLLVSVRPQSNEFPATTVGECRRRHSLRRHKGGLWTVRLSSFHRVLLQGGFAHCVTGTLWLNEGALAVWSKTSSLCEVSKWSPQARLAGALHGVGARGTTMARGVDFDGAVFEVVAIGWCATHLLPLPVLPSSLVSFPASQFVVYWSGPSLFVSSWMLPVKGLENEGCDIK